MGDRGRRAAVAVVLGALAVLVVAAMGASSSWGQVFSVLPFDPLPSPSAQMSPSASPGPSPDILEKLPDVEPIRIPGWVVGLVIVLVALAAVVLVAWIAMLVAKATREPGLRRAVEATGTAVEVPEIDQEEVSLSLEETLARLRSGMAVDHAIVQCWRRLETIAADSGIPRAATQTSEEFTVEILAHAVVDDAALDGLAELYRQAMFSTHILTDAHRERAIGCVERLAAQMGTHDAR